MQISCKSHEKVLSQDDLISKVPGYGLGDQGSNPVGSGIFLFLTTSTRTHLKAFYTDSKRSKHEAPYLIYWARI
jgi:hypothetical protein